MPISEGGKFSPVDRIVSPGVFTRENDLSGIAQGVADIGGAIVAPFPKGPAFTPTLVRSVSELEEKFGVADGVYYGPYTAKEYLTQRGLVTICRVGALTGYKQNYPFVLWAIRGTYNRNPSAGVINSGSAYTPSWSSTSWLSSSPTWNPSLSVKWNGNSGGSGTTYTGSVTAYLTSMTIPLVSGANDVAGGDNWTGSLGSASGSVLYSGTSITFYSVTASFTNVTASSAYPSQSTDRFLIEAIASGSFTASWNGSASTAKTNLSLASDTTFNNSIIYGMTLSAIRGTCAIPTLVVGGVLSGSFGRYNGSFTPDGTVTFDPCTNTWTATNSPDIRTLAVLADTQRGTISDLTAPGFSGSVFNSAILNTASSSVTTDYSITLKSSTSTSTIGTYQFSIDASSPKYITNVFGSDPKAGDPNKQATGQKIEAAYLYKVFENQLAAVVANKNKWWISGSFLPNGDPQWAGDPLDFTDAGSRNLNNADSTFSITHATTPWIISQAVASWDGSTSPTRFRLFKVHTLSDGTNTNTSYKVEISNVKLAGQVAGSDWGSFTLTVRKYSDTDKKPVILETFQNLSLDPDSSNYIARRIGDRYNYINFAGKIIEFGTFTNLSKYIRIEVSTNPWAQSAVPAGFEQLTVPVNSSMGNWVPPVRYSRASIYGVDPGKYPSGVAFNDAPVGADSQLSALYPTASIGNGVADDNLQYFAPLPAFGTGTSVGRNTVFALDQTYDLWGYEAPASTGSFLAASLSGSIPFIYDSLNETTYVKMRKFVVGFQGGFDGQSPAIPINIGSDIIPGNTQGLDCTNINSAGSIAYKQCIAALGNADEFDINLIALPGIAHQHHSYVTNLVVNMCEARGDCFYIMDLHVTPATEGSVTQIDDVVYYAKSYDTNYAAAYYPWIKILDTNTNKIITVPPSVVLPAVFAANDKSSAEWFAPAGLNRGGITQAVQVCDRTTHTDRDTLYEGRVNPIASFPGQGVCVWGQKTLQHKESALDRVNVRRLLINLKKFFASTSKYIVFEQNVSSTRNKFLSIVNPYLESVQQRSGLYAFQVVMDDSNNTPDLIDRNILYGQVYLKPTKTAEFIVLDFNILSTGAQFPGA